MRARRCAVAWEYQRNQSSFFDATTDVYGQRISTTGALLDGTGFVWASSAVASARPVLATRNGDVLCAFSELPPEQPLGAYRVATRSMFDGCVSPVSYCTSLTNSTGAVAAIGWSGDASFTTNGFSLGCSQLPNGASGSFFMGTTQIANGTPFVNGLRCIAMPLARLPLIATSNGVGSQLQDFFAPQYAGVSPGNTRHFQFWFRDSAAGGANSNVSNALSVTFCP